MAHTHYELTKINNICDNFKRISRIAMHNRHVCRATQLHIREVVSHVEFYEKEQFSFKVTPGPATLVPRT